MTDKTTTVEEPVSSASSAELNEVIARVSGESLELQARLSKLCAFMGSEKYLKLRPAHRILLAQQAEAMKKYRDILDVRYDLLEGDLLQAQSNEESSDTANS